MARFAPLTALCVAACLAAPARAEDEDMVTRFAFDGSFDDAAFAVETAILDRGLVIDHVSHVGEMLARTGADVGSEVKLFDEADIFTFCSAVVSREVMEADIMNIANCPYGIFVADIGGEVTVGFRTMQGDSMAPVQALLTEIAQEAVAN